MMETQSKILAIVGPTASGKSDLAVRLAKKYNGEIISADSRQVYRGLNIGSGKITKKEMSGVTHHLLDVANPKRQFSVALYKKLAEKAISEIVHRGKLPIICGGTGLYVDALLLGLSFPEVPPNRKLRERLEEKSPAQLFVILQKLDPRRAAEIEKSNPRRLIRAIEIVKAMGKVPERIINKQSTKYNVVWIGLRPTEKTLKQNIHKRLLRRMKQGMVGEVQKLHRKGLSWKRTEEFGLEYRFLAQYLQKKITRKEKLPYIQQESWHYAQKQWRWFKRNKEIQWFEKSNNKGILNSV